MWGRLFQKLCPVCSVPTKKQNFLCAMTRKMKPNTTQTSVPRSCEVTIWNSVKGTQFWGYRRDSSSSGKGTGRDVQTAKGTVLTCSGTTAAATTAAATTTTSTPTMRKTMTMKRSSSLSSSSFISKGVWLWINLWYSQHAKSLCLIHCHDITAHNPGVAVQLHAFLTLLLAEGQCSASCPTHNTPGKNTL